MNYPPYFQTSTATALLLAILNGTSPTVGAEPLILEEVIVSSHFREVGVMDLASSASVFNTQHIKARSANHLDQLFNMAPNVNFSTGASRGRFIQIRGIGERSQFIDPINPSVGLIIDGIDFTGLGLAASTLDIAQVEILRGPQGTLYGANALAGLVTLSSPDPEEQFTGEVSAELAEHNSHTLSAVLSGPLSDKLRYRLAVRDLQSDGHIDNEYLDKDDTNNLDEQMAKAKIQYDVSDTFVLDFTAFYIDTDNGYDAFSLSNNRKTLSDQPGHDRQESLAGSAKALWSANPHYSLEATFSAADTESEYGYDEDWTFDGFHPDGYSSTDNYERERNNLSLDIRLISQPQFNIFNDTTSWVLGFYARTEEEDLVRRESFTSQFDTDNYAIYGELKSELGSGLTLTGGWRFEKRKADYRDNLGVTSHSNEDLWGGQLTLEYQYTDDLMFYALVSRGYKAGGINGRIISASASNPAIGREVFEFDTEYLINYEFGVKGEWLDGQLQAQLAIFFQDREDVQAKQSIFDPENFSFDDFLANAAGGETSGLEIDLKYQLNSSVSLYASAGYMDAEFTDFESTSHVDARNDFDGLVLAPANLDGRDLAHAPNYQYFLGSEIALSERISLRLEVEGKDAFYFSNSHNERSDGYELFNLRLAYRADNWDLALWGRNLNDEEVLTRGFYFSNQFGNNPANGYAPEVYYQIGEPRTFGITGTYHF